MVESAAKSQLTYGIMLLGFSKQEAFRGSFPMLASVSQPWYFFKVSHPTTSQANPA